MNFYEIDNFDPNEYWNNELGKYEFPNELLDAIIFDKINKSVIYVYSNGSGYFLMFTEDIPGTLTTEIVYNALKEYFKNTLDVKRNNTRNNVTDLLLLKTQFTSDEIIKLKEAGLI